eukprot:TRINITY_DN62628_c0_g1_i1.p1 TRINITY_DN62628_c0_g1~~TRINITY_DN62628_c0_g1_i1.p1  ORF type:complete len:221 (+),score=26.99 TRINITY_DN62628_c0_g1_i1:65-727(+)
MRAALRRRRLPRPRTASSAPSACEDLVFDDDAGAGPAAAGWAQLRGAARWASAALQDDAEDPELETHCIHMPGEAAGQGAVPDAALLLPRGWPVRRDSDASSAQLDAVSPCGLSSLSAACYAGRYSGSSPPLAAFTDSLAADLPGCEVQVCGALRLLAFTRARSGQGGERGRWLGFAAAGVASGAPAGIWTCFGAVRAADGPWEQLLRRVALAVASCRPL